MAAKIAINGFGRIGRVLLRTMLAESRWPDLEVVAINDLTDVATLAHLLSFDSVHGRFAHDVRIDGDRIVIGERSILVSAHRDPAKLPWRSLGVDLVFECTGLFRSREKAGLHIEAGAKRVIVSAPGEDVDLTVAYGVNSAEYSPKKHRLVSCASCTTNCLAPVAKVLLENFGIVRGAMTTIHSYTNDQQLLDLPHKDLRRARAAALSMIPTSTGAAKAVGLVLPQLQGKVDGFAMRVPTPNVSVVDFVAELEVDTSVEQVNAALRSASEGALKGILEYCELPLVSCDFNGNQSSSIVDALSTMVIGKRMAKVVAWYDNETGFSTRMLDVAALIVAKGI